MTTTTAAEIDERCINTIRALCIDAIQAANSGHPGTPIGIAPVAYTLWQRLLRFDPADPILPNRDRYVLSSGRGSALKELVTKFGFTPDAAAGIARQCGTTARSNREETW